MMHILTVTFEFIQTVKEILFAPDPIEEKLRTQYAAVMSRYMRA